MFIATIYFVLQELNNRFNKGAVELLTLSSALNPINGYKMFDINDICKLANTFYLEDFTEQEKGNLKTQLPRHPDLKNLLIKLVLTFLVSTTTEHAFSTMKLV